MTRRELQERFPNASEAFLRRTADDRPLAVADRVAPDPVGQPSRDEEPVAEDEGGVAYKGRCLVRITSFRRRLCDERNLYDKHFVDALKEAGAFVDDSPKYVQVEVSQEQVQFAHEERTVIVLSPCHT
jgi:hypothetical protein